MPKRKRLFADPVSEIRSHGTGAVVGWVYRWNTGETMEVWVHGPQADVLRRPLARAAGEGVAAAVDPAA